MIAHRSLGARILGQGSDRSVARLPKRVVDLIRVQEISSERLIGWVQLVFVATFAVLYSIAPRPADAPAAIVQPVPVALLLYATFTLVRLRLAYRGALPSWVRALSISADTALLLSLIWSFHIHYAQPPSFSLKVPTVIYTFVFIALRTLCFNYRYVLAAGLATGVGWIIVVILAIHGSPPDTVTRSFVGHVQGGGILIGAEFDKVFAILTVTTVLTFAVWRAQQVLVTAVREETAGREVRRFLSGGVADAIAGSQTLVEAGQAAERDAAVLMLDIRGFTRYSMTVEPTQIVRLLTDFHAVVLPLVRMHGGVVDKFLGDGVMATFGAVIPSATAAADALRALDAIMTATDHWRAGLPTRGVTTPFDVNGAAASGHVVFAALGHGDRLEYTVIGDAPNLAAKLEKHNKVECTRALVEQSTYDRAVEQGWEPPRDLGRRAQVGVAGVASPLDLVVLRG